MGITYGQQQYVNEVREAAKGYLEADNFFHGHVEEIYASPKVRQMLQKSGLNDLDAINFAKIPCKAMLNRLEINTITAKSAEGADLSKILEAVQERNLMAFFTPDALKKASSLGDSYLFAWPATDEDGKVLGIDIRVNSPMTTRAFYDVEDPLLMVVVVKVWSYPTEDGEESRANFYYPDRIERWVTMPRAGNGKGTKPEDWMHYQSADDITKKKDWLIINESGEVPFFHMRTDFPYGVPDNRDAFVPQIMINKLVISHASTIDFQNFPQRYFLMDPAEDNTMGGSDSDADFPTDDDNDPESPYNRSRFRADPGEVWLATAKTAGQFQAADADTFIKPFNRYVLAMAQVCETPMHEFEPGGQPPSGESLKVAEAPLIKRCDTRKLLAGSTLRDMYAYCLELLGYPGAIVTINWKNSASAAGISDWEMAAAKIAAGIPNHIVYAEMGYDEEVQKTWHHGHSEPDDLAYGTILLDERRAEIGYGELPNGEGKVRVAMPGNGASDGQGMDPHMSRLAAEADPSGVIGDGQVPHLNGKAADLSQAGVHGG